MVSNLAATVQFHSLNKFPLRFAACRVALQLQIEDSIDCLYRGFVIEASTSWTARSVKLSLNILQGHLVKKITSLQVLIRATLASGLVAASTLGPAPVAAQSKFISSRPSAAGNAPVETALPAQVSRDSVVFQGAEPVMPKQSRTRTCLEIYGSPAPEVTYTGGPIVEARFELADGQWSDWQRESGPECVRNHEYTRTTTPCPTNQQGIITELRRYSVTESGAIINDTGWVETSRTCAYYYVRTDYETRAVSCPTNQQGAINERRSYDVWSDGSFRNYGAWTETARTCAYYYLSTSYETQAVACPANQQGAIYQQRTIQNWSDGSKRNPGAWVETSRTCAYYYLYTAYENTTGGCPAGSVGYQALQRSYQVWSDGSARSYSSWYVTGNYCQAIRCSYSYYGKTYVTRFTGPGSGNSYFFFYVNGSLVGSTSGTTLGNYYVGPLQLTEWVGSGGDADNWIGDRTYYTICGPL